MTSVGSGITGSSSGSHFEVKVSNDENECVCICVLDCGILIELS